MRSQTETRRVWDVFIKLWNPACANATSAAEHDVSGRTEQVQWEVSMLEFRIEKILHVSHVTAISHIPAQSACFRVTSGVSCPMNLFAAAVLTELFCARCMLTADEPKLGLDQDASAIGVTTSVSAEVNAVDNDDDNDTFE